MPHTPEHRLHCESDVRPVAALNFPAEHWSHCESAVRPVAAPNFPAEHTAEHLEASVLPVDASTWYVPATQAPGHAFASEVSPVGEPNRPELHSTPVQANAEDVCPVAVAYFPATVAVSHAVPTHAVASDVCPIAVAYRPAAVAAPHAVPHAFASEVLPVAVPNLPALHALPQALASEVLPVMVPNFPALHKVAHASASVLLPVTVP